jgi:antitoxin YefM
MDSVSVNKFRDNLKSVVELAASRHEPVKVTRRSDGDFIVISAEDWEREQETLYVLQNCSLMTQIATSLQSHQAQSGYVPTRKELDEITGV